MAFGIPPEVRSPANLIWLANPILFAAWLFIFANVKIFAILLSVAALFVSGAFLLASKVIIDESGSLVTITGYSIGYWLWLASMIAACGAAFTISKHNALDDVIIDG
jgi:hypothetical protein